MKILTLITLTMMIAKFAHATGMQDRYCGTLSKSTPIMEGGSVTQAYISVQQRILDSSGNGGPFVQDNPQNLKVRAVAFYGKRGVYTPEQHELSSIQRSAIDLMVNGGNYCIEGASSPSTDPKNASLDIEVTKIYLNQ
jgi:hypothetical protein